MTARRKPDDARAAGVQTLIDVLEYRARNLGDRVIFRELHGDGVEAVTLTYAGLQTRARSIAAALADSTVVGDRVVLLVPPGADYIAAFFGCLYAGVVAVPAYPPHPRRPDARVGRMVADCGARVALVHDDFAARLERYLAIAPELKPLTWLNVSHLQATDPALWRHPDVSRDALAMLQYTSGSTAEPRGVMLAHAQLLDNAIVIHAATAHEEGDSAVFWLPPFHDMGLLGGVVQPVYADVPTAVMAPTAFLQRPARWLEAIAKYGATTSGAPNFAFDLCVERVSPAERERLDLSSWRTAFNGAELVRGETIARFTRAFAASKLRKNVFVPCYGLAEATLLVAAGRVRVDAGAAALPSPVAVGAPMAGLDVRIADPDAAQELAEGEVGEIWVAGESVARGYWGRPDATRAAFGARLHGRDGAYLRTGDLGTMIGGELTVTGRLKDLIILAGRNFYPHDIEVAAERSHAHLRSGFSAAFSVAGESGEELVYVAEVVRQHQPSDGAAVMRAIRTELAAAFGILPATVVLVRAHTIPRTSSGKLRRGACRAAHLAGALEVVGEWRRRRPDVATQSQALAAFIADWLGAQFGLDPAALNRDTRLRDCGMDSLAATLLMVALEEQTGRRLEPATLWAQETIGALVDAVLAPAAHASSLAPAGLHGAPGQPTAASTDVSSWPEVQQLQARLDALAAAGIANPFFARSDGVAGRHITVSGRRVLNFASYNYLGLSGDAAVSAAAREAVDRWGTSVSASRLVSGERTVHADLESAIAAFLGVDAALTFIGGHSANVSTIPLLVGTGDLVLCDANLHNSGMLGAQYSGAKRLLFPHNDAAALETLLARHRAHHRRALVVIEGLYSADGDVPDLAAFVAVKRRHHAQLMVDEAHSLGVLGATGRGIAEHAGVAARDVDVWMGTLSKAFASSGGFIAGGAALIEYLRYSAPGFVFSVGMTPPDAAAAQAALARLVAEPALALRAQANGARFASLARAAGLDVGASGVAPIVAVIVGSSARALRLAAYALAHGVNVAPMIAPAVAEGGARLRFFVTAEHREEDLVAAVEVVRAGLSELGGVAVAEPGEGAAFD